MTTKLMVEKKHGSRSTGLIDRVKSRFNNRLNQSKTENRFGRNLGVIWEFRRSSGEDPIACLVKIEKKQNSAKVTICDGNDSYGPGADLVLECIATGVYLEHLADSYSPNAIEFFFERTSLADPQGPEWGIYPVNLLWKKDEQLFEYSSLGEWTAHFLIPQNEKDFIQKLRAAASIEVERVMRERNAQGEVTTKERELYDRYQEHILKKAERYRYSLSGSRVFLRPEI